MTRSHFTNSLPPSEHECPTCGKMFFKSERSRHYTIFCSMKCRFPIRPLKQHPTEIDTLIVPLDGDNEAYISACDADLIGEFNWTMRGHNGKQYASRHDRSGTPRFPLMHRVILGAKPGEFVDHKDGNGLNNRRSNLRIATIAQNSANRKGASLCGFKGVSASRSRWRAAIMHKGKQIHIGLRDTPEEAARAYDEMARLIYGEFARTNFD